MIMLIVETRRIIRDTQIWQADSMYMTAKPVNDYLGGRGTVVQLLYNVV